MSDVIIINTVRNLPIWVNIIVIILYILCMIGLLFTLNFLYEKVLNTFASKIGKYIGSKINSSRITETIIILSLILTILFVVASIYFLIYFRFKLDTYALIYAPTFLFFVFIIFVRDSIVVEYKRKFPSYNSIVFSFINEIIIKLKIEKLKQFYFIDRVVVFSKQTPSLLVVSSIMVVILTFTILPNWTQDNSHYFLILLIIPFFMNYWIYFTGGYRINSDKEAVFTRRIFMYICCFIIVIVQQNTEFKMYLSQYSKISDVELFVYSGILILFITIDRVLKEFSSDYQTFHSSRKNGKVMNLSPNRRRFVKRKSIRKR